MNAAKASSLEKAIAQLPRVKLASVRPTPLEPIPRLSAQLKSPALHIKRDDLTGLAFGGNKTRMFEFALADALEKGADTIVSGAAVQSNYCRQLAAAYAKLDLELHLILRPVREIDKTQSQGNNLLQHLLGAHITVIEEGVHIIQKKAIQAKCDELAAQGKNVYWPRREDTVDLDAIAQPRDGVGHLVLLPVEMVDSAPSGSNGFLALDGQPCAPCLNVALLDSVVVPGPGAVGCGQGVRPRVYLIEAPRCDHGVRRLVEWEVCGAHRMNRTGANDHCRGADVHDGSEDLVCHGVHGAEGVFAGEVDDEVAVLSGATYQRTVCVYFK